MARDDKTEEVSPEVAARRAMGKTDTPPDPDDNDAASDTSGGYFVPAAGLDPDSIQRVVKHLPGDIAAKAGLGAQTPEELSDQRTAYGEAVNAARNPQGPRTTDDASDEEKAARTGQPLGDGKSTGAPSADDPGSGIRVGKLTADDKPGSELDVAGVDVGAASVTEAVGDRQTASQRRASAQRGTSAGESQVRGRSASGPRSTTAKDGEEK